MNVVSNKTLAYWKECAVTLRQIIAKGQASKGHLRELVSALRYAKRKITKIEGKVLVCVVCVLLIGGCNMVHGAFKDSAWLLDKAAENTEVQESK